jgi:hypothetical protein
MFTKNDEHAAKVGKSINHVHEALDADGQYKNGQGLDESRASTPTQDQHSHVQPFKSTKSPSPTK